LASVILLTVRVHVDAFLLAPRTYLRAVAWRLRGLKVRSRNSIAPLLGRSPRAYRLWMSRTEPALMPPSALAASTILPVIDCRAGASGVEHTMASIAASGGTLRPVTIGGAAVAGATRIDQPNELSELGGEAGIWLCPLSPGDRLAPGALSAYAAAATSASSLIYADDDIVSGEERSAPHFKPDWNPDLFEHHDYLTGSSILFADRAALASTPDQGWVEDLVGQALRAGAAPRHLPYVLHHRRSRPAPVVPSLPPALLADPAPLVSVIIPTRNHLGLLQTCIEGVRRAAYPRLETVVIDNDSDDPGTLDYLSTLEREGVTVLRMPGAFNYSALNNAAVDRASGALLCFLNNDVEMIDRDWLAVLVRQALRPEIGAVGARLLYPDRTIQHAGVFTGIGGGAGHGHRFQRADDPGYFDRARLPQQVSAVTAACLVVARDKFLAVGGFDEETFPVAFNDVDLCLKLNARGWQSLYEPRATLIHHESKSRGDDRARPNRLRFAAELAALKRKWHTDANSDPYHHPQLSSFSEQFVVAV
jgi:GT2 family glycosyltransferase